MKRTMRTIQWEKDSIKIIDQTKLPGVLEYLYIKDIKSLWKAIRELKVRGAPALGAAAALGVYVGIRDSRAEDFSAFSRDLKNLTDYLASARPTARNLFWGLERMRSVALKNKQKPMAGIKKILLKEAQKIITEDMAVCRLIGSHGAPVIKDGTAILTICNTGALATIDYGTALGVMYKAKAQGKRIKVFACETRPLLQGARLTAWELRQRGIDVTLICDSMAAALMQQGKIDLVIVGADRIARNGDAANKIGTYTLAVASRFHKIPFYVAAPTSTFDLSLKSGREIPIEQRDPLEITALFFKRPICTEGVKVLNPAFDITPGNLITALITEKGIIRQPFLENIPRMLKK